MKDYRQIAAQLQHNFQFLACFPPIFINGYLHEIFKDVEALVTLLLRAYTRRYWIPYQNARPKGEGGQFWRLQKASKINWLP